MEYIGIAVPVDVEAQNAYANALLTEPATPADTNAAYPDSEKDLNAYYRECLAEAGLLREYLAQEWLLHRPDNHCRRLTCCRRDCRRAAEQTCGMDGCVRAICGSTIDYAERNDHTDYGHAFCPTHSAPMRNLEHMNAAVPVNAALGLN